MKRFAFLPRSSLPHFTVRPCLWFGLRLEKSGVCYMKKLMGLMLGLFMFSSMNVHAFTECRLTPHNVWSALDGQNIWICFKAGNCVFKNQSATITEKHLDRMYAMGMAAVSAGKDLLVRYTEDNLNCSVLGTSHKTDAILGMWFMK
jgi:hypothetical protein